MLWYLSHAAGDATVGTGGEYLLQWQHMSTLKREDVLHLARLARLDLSDQEISSLQTELSAILQYVEQLQSVDVEGLPPTNQVTGLTNVMREDAVRDYGDTPESLLENVPAVEHDGHIRAGRMIG